MSSAPRRKQERDDKVGRALADAIQRRQPAEACPDNDRFVAAIDNKLPEADLDAFRAHLAACPRCLEAYTAAHGLVHDSFPTGFQSIRWGRWAGSLIAVAAVAVLAIRMSQKPEVSTLVATTPPPATKPTTPPRIQPRPNPAQKKSESPVSPQPRQTLLAFADADDFWNSAVGGRDDTSYGSSRMRGFSGVPSVMSDSSSAMLPSPSGKDQPTAPHAEPLQAFRIGVSLRQVQLARDAADRAALADRSRVLAGRLKSAGLQDAAQDTAPDKLARLQELPFVRLGVWAESVREASVKGESPDTARLVADADSLLELDFTAGVKADLSKIRSELYAEGGAVAVKRDVILKLLAEIVADL